MKFLLLFLKVKNGLELFDIKNSIDSRFRLKPWFLYPRKEDYLNIKNHKDIGHKNIALNIISFLSFID